MNQNCRCSYTPIEMNYVRKELLDEANGRIADLLLVNIPAKSPNHAIHHRRADKWDVAPASKASRHYFFSAKANSSA